MAPDPEIEMLRKFDGKGKGLYKKWKCGAQRLSDVLSAYSSLSSTATASYAMEIAVRELEEGLRNERVCWEVFENYCIDNTFDPDDADSNLSIINVSARNRIVRLSIQADGVRRATDSGTTTRVPIKMPTISLPKFSGKREEWTNFWTLFTDLVHNKPELTFSHKFSYLQQSCVDEARELITGFIPNEQGYQNAIKLLNEQFDETHLLQHQLQSKLLSIKAPSHSLEDLKAFRLEYQKIIRTLESSASINGHAIIKTLLFNKLNSNTTKKIVERAGIDFNYDEFDKQLLQLIQQMEFCKSQDERAEKPKTKVNVNSAFVRSATNGNLCVFCSEEHVDFKCPTYVSVSSRKDRLMKDRRCFRCGKRGHLAAECRSYLTCHFCKSRHWTAMCANGKNDTSAKQNAPTFQTTVDASKREPKVPYDNSRKNPKVLCENTPVVKKAALSPKSQEEKKKPNGKVKVRAPTTNTSYQVIRS